MGVIDEFRKSNWILDHITFDDAVSPTGGGATPTYSYTRLKTQPTAQFRAINTEYTPSEVTKERHSVDIKVFGGSYQIDRVIANMGGIVSEVELQQSQKIKAAQALFNDTFINGDEAVDTNAFDGPRLLNWFRDHGYEVETPEPEAQEPEAAERPEKRTAKKAGE